MKPRIKKVGKLPYNARIDVDYTGKKPKVRIQYVRWRKKNRPDVFDAFSPGLIDAALISCALYLLFFCNYNPYHTYSNCTFIPSYSNVSGLNLNGTNMTYAYTDEFYLNCSRLDGGGNEVYRFERYPSHLAGFTMRPLDKNLTALGRTKWTFDQQPELYPLIIFGILYFTLPFFFSFILFPLAGRIPLFKGFIERRKLKGQESNAKFIPYAKYKFRFTRCPPENIIEIPIFENKCMFYKATEDFSAYLQYIRIREHPFTRMIRKKAKTKEGKKLKLRRWVQNESLFWCKFYFSQNPKKGKLEVIWK